jgi:glutaredoxin
MIIFTANWCSACHGLKKTLDSKSIPYETVDVDSEDGMELAAKHSIRSLPSALIDGDVVSGAQNILKAI